MLIGYPFLHLANYLRSGLRQGFHLGYTGTCFQITPRNLKSALENRLHVTEAIRKELVRRHNAWPFNVPPLQHLHCSLLVAVPKKDGSWCLIIDLSSPKCQSVNEHIPKDAFFVTFNTFDDAVNMVKRLGRGALMGKVDIKHAFRFMPVHPEDWNLLGTCWDGHYFVELRLPFGCRSSVFIFNTLANALAWILQVKYAISLLTHYLDDFFTCGAPDSDQCRRNLCVIIDVFHHLGVPLAMDKLIGPVTLIIYFEIEIDSIAEEIRLPKDKFNELMSCLQFWSGQKKCMKWELLSLIGKLSFAAKVVWSGRIFLRHLINLSSTVPKLYYHITLNQSAQEDIAWWLTFVPTWNGKSIILDAHWTSSDSLVLFTDAAPMLGFGGVFGDRWFSCAWPTYIQEDPLYSIQWKELLSIYVACTIWGSEWTGKKILFYTDNEAITLVWENETSHCKPLMQLVRKVFWVAAENDFIISLKHIQVITMS